MYRVEAGSIALITEGFWLEYKGSPDVPDLDHEKLRSGLGRNFRGSETCSQVARFKGHGFNRECAESKLSENRRGGVNRVGAGSRRGCIGSKRGESA